MLDSQIDKIKNAVKYQMIKSHIKKNKDRYITTVVAAGITCLIMRDPRLFGGGLNAKDVCGEVNAKTQTIMDSIFVGRDNYGTVTNNHVPKSLSYIVQQDGTDNWWRAQSEYARERGLSDTMVSQHINHNRPLSNGESLTRRGIAQ
jgi:hypothetical protein